MTRRVGASTHRCRLGSLRFSALTAMLISGELGASYDDSYIGETLPGSEFDSRGLPNSPFSVDVNRLSDGVSSVSPLSTTSPSFPLYQNVTDERENEWERQWANLTRSSRVEQGVSPSDAGSFEIAVARHRLLLGNYSAEKPSATFPVNAWERWNPSAFAIQAGERYTVSVPGQQYWQDGRVRSDAGGYAVYYDAVDTCWVAVGRCRSYLHGTRPRVPPPRARWMELICGVGDVVSPLRDAVDGQKRYLPIDDGALRTTLLPVGRDRTFLANATGELVCFANDAEGLYGNNRASLNVTVTRESWPPSGSVESVYEAYVGEASPLRP